MWRLVLYELISPGVLGREEDRFEEIRDFCGRTSKAAAVEASWSFSTASICLKMSLLIPDT